MNWKQSTNPENVLTYFKHGLLQITKYQASRQENHAAPRVKIYWMLGRWTMSL